MYIYEVEGLINDGRGLHFTSAVALFSLGSKKGKSSHDDEYGHGQQKQIFSTCVMENTEKQLQHNGKTLKTKLCKHSTEMKRKPKEQ